jgi:hypothetical protein
MKFDKKYWGRTSLVSIILIVTACTTATAADQEEEKSPEHRLQPLVVEGKSITQREELSLDSTSNPYRVEASGRFGTEVFSEKEIQDLHPEDLNDLLDKAAGINLTYQGRKSPFFIQERGGGTFTYIIDGAILPPSSNRILYKFPVAAIEELQIVRGATSLTLGPSIPIGASNSGSGLNTGYIIIRTKQPQKTEGVLTASVAQASGGHPAETNESLYAGTRLGNDSPLKGYISGMAAKMDRPSQDSWFDGRSSQSGMGKGGFAVGKLNVNMMVYKDSGTLEMQRGVKADGSLAGDKWYYDPLETTLYTSDMRLQWTPDQTTLFNIFLTQYDQTEHNESFISAGSTAKEYEEETSGFGLRHNARFGNTLMQLGGQMSNSNGSGPNLSKSYNKYDTTIIGWSASVEQKLFHEALILDGGYRQDTKHIDYASTLAANDDANNDVDMAPAKVYAIGGRWKIADIYALSGRYFRGDQGTSGDFDMRSQTGALHAEKQDRIEIGLEAEYASWFKPAVTWFSIDTTNKKTAANTTYTLAGTTYYYYTEADENRDGLELMIKGDIGKNTSYKLSWTFLLKCESTSNGVTTDAIGTTVPENLYTLALSHQWKAYRFNVSIKRVDEWTDSSSAMGYAETEGLGDYTRIDANIKRDFTLQNTRLTATLFGTNLGDENYSTRYVTGYYPARGRTIGLELSWAF